MRDRRFIAGVALAVVAVAAAALLRGGLTPVLEVGDAPFLAFFPAIALATLYGGVAAGAVATVVAFGIADYYFIPPVGSLVQTLREWVTLALSLTSASLIVTLCEAHRRIRERSRQDAARLVQSERETREHAVAMTRLHALGGLFAEKGGDVQRCRQEAIEVGIALTAADKGTLQVLDDASETLRIVAHRGFDAAFLNHFAIVDTSGASACAMAVRCKERIVVEDVAHGDSVAGQLSRDVLRHAGVGAMQSTPLMSSAGTFIGIISTYFASPWHPSERQLALMDLLARQVADFLERQRAEAELSRVNAALRDADRRRTEFLATLGHELRNPLAAISSAVSVLNILDDPKQASSHARVIIGRQVHHLARLVDDLLDVSRISIEKVRLNRQPLDLAECARDAMSLLRSTGRLERHDITVDLAPVWIDADEHRIAQILTNLVDNALKYTPAGGSIAVRVHAQGDRAVLEVSDSGIGLAPELIDKIFDLFVQGDPSPGHAPSGLGIGLTLVKSLVVMHGGAIEVRSEGAGKGAVFAITLPTIARPEHRPHGEEAALPSLQPGRQRILVVEDDPDVREMLCAALSLDGHEVTAAADGPSGLEALRAYRPDVALIDVGLPGIDGYEVAREARGIVGKTVRLVALTGYGGPEDRRQALRSGFDAHLVKPVDPDALTAVLLPRDQPSPQSVGAMAWVYDPVEDAVVQCREARRVRAQAEAARMRTQQLRRASTRRDTGTLVGM